MRHRPPSPRLSGDRGATLAEMVIAMGLTAAAMASVVGLMASSARTVEELSADDPLAGVAVDWLTDDLRVATDLDVVATTGSDVVTLDVTTPDGVVRWGSGSGVVSRLAPGESEPAQVVEGLRDPDALVLALLDADGDAVDPADPTGVDDCTALVRIRLLAAGDVLVHDRIVGLRDTPGEAPSC